MQAITIFSYAKTIMQNALSEKIVGQWGKVENSYGYNGAKLSKQIILIWKLINREIFYAKLETRNETKHSFIYWKPLGQLPLQQLQEERWIIKTLYLLQHLHTWLLNKPLRRSFGKKIQNIHIIFLRHWDVKFCNTNKMLMKLLRNFHYRTVSKMNYWYKESDLNESNQHSRSTFRCLNRNVIYIELIGRR